MLAKLIFTPIRWFLGRVILTLDFIFTPRGVKRAAQEQAEIDKSTKALSLYQFKACPFCVKVRRTMKRQSLTIELRDAKTAGKHRDTLLNQGGKVKVPCLRIDSAGETKWLYDSKEIINYLQQNYGSAEGV